MKMLHPVVRAVEIAGCPGDDGVMSYANAMGVGQQNRDTKNPDSVSQWLPVSSLPLSDTTPATLRARLFCRAGRLGGDTSAHRPVSDLGVTSYL